MSTNAKVPDTKQLEELVDQLEGESETKEAILDGIKITVEEAKLAVAGLKWLCNFLNDRRTYHKRQQIKKNTLIRIAKEKMSKQELEEVDAAANAEAQRTVLPAEEVDSE